MTDIFFYFIIFNISSSSSSFSQILRHHACSAVGAHRVSDLIHSIVLCLCVLCFKVWSLNTMALFACQGHSKKSKFWIGSLTGCDRYSPHCNTVMFKITVTGTFRLMWEVNHGGGLTYVTYSIVDFVFESRDVSAMYLACEINKEQKCVTMSVLINYLQRSKIISDHDQHAWAIIRP